MYGCKRVLLITRFVLFTHTHTFPPLSLAIHVHARAVPPGSSYRPSHYTFTVSKAFLPQRWHFLLS
jgi:hypothetical protein